MALSTAGPAAESSVARAAQVRELAEILRAILVAGVASSVAGILVGGIGGRIVMRLATLLNPEAVGRFTENGNQIGDITLEGTLALVMFGGLASGMIASGFWIAVEPWLPRQGVARLGAAIALAVPIAGVFVIDPYSDDFALLAADVAIVAMLLVMAALFPPVLIAVQGFVDRRLRHPGHDPSEFALATSGLVLLGGVMVAPGAVAVGIAADACLCTVTPIPVVLPLILPLGVAAAATAATWVRRVRAGGSAPSRWVTAAGRGGVAGSWLLAMAILAKEILALPR